MKKEKKQFTRRQILGSATAGFAATVIPRHVLGGKNNVAPSDKLTLGYIGCGTQGLREMCRLLTNPEVHIVSVCDPNRRTTDYVDWSPLGLIRGIRTALDEPNWGNGLEGIPGGRDFGQEIVQKYYAKQRGSEDFQGCKSYSDFRELLDQGEDLDAVKVMTPDHLHASVSIAAMKEGKHVVIHKPIANRISEARLTIETARKTGVKTHLLAWSKKPGVERAKAWIRNGAIGKLREIHNWSNRPVWPQWTMNPTETPPIPDGFDWDLWLGPVPHRPYHPNYTHAVFRGWYDFGAGAIADMGTYSLWPLFLSFGFDTPPIRIEANGTTTASLTNHVSRRVRNDVAFPYSSVIRFTFPPQGEWPKLDIWWHDGGMKPPRPETLYTSNKQLEREGMLFIGDQGVILAGFRCEDPRIWPEERMRRFAGDSPPLNEEERSDRVWIESFKAGTESPGSFLRAEAVTETILLGAVALRAGEPIFYDSKNMQVTNPLKANEYLGRKYRKGWEL